MKNFYGQRSRIKRNQCKVPNCYLPVWGHGYCNKHQYLYQAKQPIPKYKKRKPAVAEKYGFQSQMELFQYVIYNAPRPIICPVSGEDITKLFDKEPEVWIHCCMHVLPKGKYTRWKLNPHNIVLALPEVHHLYDGGTEAQRQAKEGWDWDYLYDLSDKLKQEYNDEYRKEKGPIYDQGEMDAAQQDGEEDGQEGDDNVPEAAAADRDEV